jgi:hypothetical protein
VRVLPHIKKLDDCFVSTDSREVGVAGKAGDSDAMLAVREEGRRGRRGDETETARCAEESALTKGSAFDPELPDASPDSGRWQVKQRTLTSHVA